MGWSPPKSCSVGDILTSSDMNTYVRDNFNAISQPPKARIYASSGQSIANFTATQVTPTTTDFAAGITAASGSLTIVTAGTYLVTACVTYGGAVAADSQIGVYIYRNGSAVRQGSSDATTGSHGAAFVSDLINCSAADVLELWTVQVTGSAYALDTTGTPEDTSLSALWVSF